MKDTATGKEEWLRGIFEMIGTGKEVFADEDPDEYVRRLREGWDEPDSGTLVDG